MKITLPSGLVVNHVNYVLSGPQTYSGTIDVTSSSVIQLGLSNIAPGANYVLSETATTQDGGAVCSGASAPFNVAAGATASVNVALACTTPADSGAMVGTTVASACATVTSAIASPSETTVGSVAQLTSNATAPVPTALTYQWSASAGTIDTPTSPNAHFTCPSTPGPVTITLTAGDGPIPAGGSCPASDTTTTLTVTCDALVVDAGPADTSVAIDTGSDSGAAVDTGTDAAPSLVPCTTAGQTGCVACSGNAGGVCSAAEALLVQKDIAAGNATTTPCYTCALNAGCIDDTTFGDKGLECGDLSGNFQQTGLSSSSLCLTTLQCILSTGCASSAAAGCYCGSSVGPSCVSATTPNGACLNQEVQGLGLTSNQDILKNFTNITLPSGQANQFAQCALSNSCAACLK